MNDAQPNSRLVTWGGYLALSFLVLIPLAVITVRSGNWQQGLGLYAMACAGSLVILVIFVIASLFPGFRRWRPALFARIMVALPGTLLTLALLGGSGDVPAIHDITTDTEDPPTFVTAPEQRGEGANPLDIKPDSIAAQLNAYTDIATLRTDSAMEGTFERALLTAEALGWEVYHKDLAAGIIEAVDATTIMNFKDDVVIRLRGDGDGGTLVDLRSVSRVGRGDLGANAQRIRDFSQQFSK